MDDSCNQQLRVHTNTLEFATVVQILGANNMKRWEVGRTRTGRLEDHDDALLNHWKHATRTVLDVGS